jgi:HAD superfamily hydrolase (TIGR01509 family)
LDSRVDAVIFDLDGVLIDSEELWAQARERIAREHGGSWDGTTQRRMMGMSSTEWSRFMNEELGVELPPREISSRVVDRLAELYRQDLPLIPGATDAVERLAAVWPLGLASSANRPLIELVLELAGLSSSFSATISSEEVERGKPAPDVYLEAAARLGVAPHSAVVVEDSTNGIRAGKAAGMSVIAIPDSAYPPEPAALNEADLVLGSIEELTTAAVSSAARPAPRAP